MSLLESEFTVLRQTIAARGTVRVVILVVTVLSWSALTVVLLLFSALPVASVYTLAVLAAGFEGIHALHVGVERIGRYIQVYFEGEGEGPRWESTAMAVGPSLPGGGIDPLFTVLFVCAAVLNLIPAVLPEPAPIEMGVLGTLHLAFLIRVLRARGAAARQRAIELESFRALKSRQTETKL